MPSHVPCLHKQVQRLTLLRRKALLERLDVTPWIAIYGVALYVANTTDAAHWPVSPWVLLPLAIILHILSLLFQVWSTAWRVLVTCAPVASIDAAEAILVEPVPHAGSAAIVPVRRRVSAPGEAPAAVPEYRADGTPVPPHVAPANGTGGRSGLGIADWLLSSPVEFEYQSMTFHLARMAGSSDAPGGGSGLAFVPLSSPDCAPLAAYVGWRGWETAAQVQAATGVWGYNAVETPPPSFAALLQEQAVRAWGRPPRHVSPTSFAISQLSRFPACRPSTLPHPHAGCALFCVPAL